VPTLLLKTEPSEYSFDDLVREKKTVWNGITNPGALIAMRAAKKGDEAFIYHTGDERRIVGLAALTTDAYPDPDAANEKIVAFDLKPLRAARSPVSLAQIKADPRFKDFALVRQGRLSVIPVPPGMDRALRELAGL